MANNDKQGARGSSPSPRRIGRSHWRPECSTNDFFIDLLDVGTASTQLADGVFEGRDLRGASGREPRRHKLAEERGRPTSVSLSSFRRYLLSFRRGSLLLTNRSEDKALRHRLPSAGR